MFDSRYFQCILFAFSLLSGAADAIPRARGDHNEIPPPAPFIHPLNGDSGFSIDAMAAQRKIAQTIGARGDPFPGGEQGGWRLAGHPMSRRRSSTQAVGAMMSDMPSEVSRE